jgi:hypothetical protein
MFAKLTMRILHAKNIGRVWFLLVGGVWGLFWSIDQVVEKWGSGQLRDIWERNTSHLPDWRLGLIISLSILVVFLIEGSFREHNAHSSEVLQLRQQFAASASGLPPFRPKVVPVSYGLNTSSGSYGLFVANDGYAAYEVTVPQIYLPRSTTRLMFKTTLARLVDKDGQVFFPATTITYCQQQESDGDTLCREVMSMGLSEVRFSILYKDADQHWYATRCLLEPEGDNEDALRVTFVSQDLATAPSIFSELSFRLPLEHRILDVCRALTEFVVAQGARGSEMELWSRFMWNLLPGISGADSKAAFIKEYQERIDPWDKRISAGYWKYFRNDVADLRQELASLNLTDLVLDKAMDATDQDAGSEYASFLLLIVERLRFLASKLPD